MPQGPTGRYYWEDHNTGESGEMPWSAERDPTDYEIDSYRARSSAPDTSTWGGWLSDKIPDPVESAWEWANKPMTDAPSRWARQIAPEGEGNGFAGYGALTRFVGDAASSMSSPLNLGLTAISGGAYGAGRAGLARAAGALSGIEMGAGAAQTGLGAYHLSQAESLPEAAGAGAEMLFGGLGYMGGRAGRAAHAPDVPGTMPDPFAPKPGVIDDPSRLLGPGPRFEAGPGGVGEIAPPAPITAPPPNRAAKVAQRGSLDSITGEQFGGGIVDPADPYLGAGLGTDVRPAGGIEIAGLGDVAAPELPLQPPVHPRGPSALRPFEQDAGIWQQMQEPVPGQAAELGAITPPEPVRPAQDFWREEIGRAPEMTPGPVDVPHPADLAAVTNDIEVGQRGVPDVDSPALQEATVAAMAAEEAAPAPIGPRVGQPPAPRTAAEAQAYVESLGQPAGTTREALMPPPVAPPARDALARVAMVADQPVTPKPLVRPAKPKAPTPDRIQNLGRGVVKDAVRTIFPDKLHADLFAAFGRARKIMRGERNVIPPDYEGLAKQMGVSVKDVQRIASEYRLKVLQMAKDLPDFAPKGRDVIDMEAPHWGGKTEMVPAAPVPPPVDVAPTPAVVPEPIPPTTAELTAALKEQGAKPVKPKVTQTATRPKSKSVRVSAIMDELVTLGPAEMQAISNDPARLLATAKAAGIKSTTLKSAMQEWFQKVGGPETGGLKVGPSDKRVAQVKEMKSNLQEWFKKVGGSEKGALGLPSKAQMVKGFEQSFDAANSVRMTSMLSGLALPKSVAGNLGAHLAAALEGRTLKPLKVLTNIKAIRRDLKSGWQAGANPALTQGFNKANLPGRAMGAGDFAGIESLKRAGLSEKEAKELMLTGANQISSWWPLETRLGKLLVPFRTTPFNQFAQGITRWKKHPEVAAAAAILGAMSGAKVDDMESISLMSAFAGPYAIPFLVGAWAASGKAEMLNQISPMPEWGITKTITNPFGAFTESPGRRWFRPGVGFGEEAKKERQRESLERRRAKRRAAAGLD
jgi:hypothetical protein